MTDPGCATPPAAGKNCYVRVLAGCLPTQRSRLRHQTCSTAGQQQSANKSPIRVNSKPHKTRPVDIKSLFPAHKPTLLIRQEQRCCNSSIHTYTHSYKETMKLLKARSSIFSHHWLLLHLREAWMGMLFTRTDMHT